MFQPKPEVWQESAPSAYLLHYINKHCDLRSMMAPIRSFRFIVWGQTVCYLGCKDRTKLQSSQLTVGLCFYPHLWSQSFSCIWHNEIKNHIDSCAGRLASLYVIGWRVQQFQSASVYSCCSLTLRKVNLGGLSTWQGCCPDNLSVGGLRTTDWEKTQVIVRLHLSAECLEILQGKIMEKRTTGLLCLCCFYCAFCAFNGYDLHDFLLMICDVCWCFYIYTHWSPFLFGMSVFIYLCL